VFVNISNQLIMGSRGTPTVPLLIGQGAYGVLEGTQPSPTFGTGDGVMVTGDVRALAREYCARGVTVDYLEYASLGHIATVLAWLPTAATWLAGRFAGQPAPQNCAQIPPGNSLAPVG
jgi:hypothetical protein